MQYFTADKEFPTNLIGYRGIVPYSLFLGGTIDDGKSEDWQKKVVEFFDQTKNEFLTIFNPRDSEWDLECSQSDSEPRFRKQVDWEQDGLKHSSLILMYFVGGSRSIISMCELGQYSKSGKLIVVADKDYFKRGNIEVLSRRDGFILLDNLEAGVDLALETIVNKYKSDIDLVTDALRLDPSVINKMTIGYIDLLSQSMRKKLGKD